MMRLGEAIRIMRQKALYTQEDLAKALNVAPSTVNRWEANKATPNIRAMKSIKLFCEQCDLDFNSIEKLWIDNPTKAEKE